MSNPFFSNCGPFKIGEIFQSLNLKSEEMYKNEIVNDVKDLATSNTNDITFFHSKRYKDLANNTKASFCITNDNLKELLPDTCKPIIVKNVLLATSTVTAKFYPSAINDNFDSTANFIDKTIFKDKVKFGHNVLIGDNVSIGSNCMIGHNTVIERNVSITDDIVVELKYPTYQDIISNNILGKTDNSTEIGGTPNNGAIKKISMVQGGEIAFGDTTTSNFLGIAEGTNNNFADSDTMGIYYRNGLNVYSSSIKESGLDGVFFCPPSINTFKSVVRLFMYI